MKINKNVVMAIITMLISACASVETYEGKNSYSEQDPDATSYALSVYKKSSLNKIGEYKNDDRLTIYQEVDALSKRLWKSRTDRIVKTAKIADQVMLDLIDLDGDNYPEQYAYWGGGRSRENTQDFGFIYDLNNDTKIDYIVFYQGILPGEAEADSFKIVVTFHHWIDTNYDGIIDTWVYPDVDLNGNDMVDEGIYAWLYDTNYDGKVDAGEYLGKDTIKSIDPENDVYKIKCIVSRESGERSQELSNAMLIDINSIIQ